MNCPRCFGEIKPNQKFCPTCGFEIGTTEIEGVKTMAADVPGQSFSQPESMQYQETQQPEGMQYGETQQPEGMQYGETQQPEGMQYAETQQPAAPQCQPTEQPAMPQYQQPVQPASNPHDYSQQYQQYQRGTGIQGTRSGDGSLPPEKKKTTIIVLIAVIAALVIAGAVVALVLIFGGKGGDGDNNTPPESSQTSVIESTLNTESTESVSTEPSSSSTQPPATTVEPSTEPTESTTSPVPLGESNTVKNSNGVVLASDAAIDTTDSSTEAKIKSFLESQGVEDSTNSLTTMKYYAVGNVYVQEEQLLEKSTDTERETYKSLMDLQFANADERLTTMRTASNVNNMVYVYVLLDSDDEIIYQKLLK